ESPSRMPNEPPTNAVIYGPRVGFTENIKANIAMLRKRLPTENLVLKEFVIGTYTKTKVCLSYLKGIANMHIVKEISKKLEDINIDGIIDTHYILSYLQKDEIKFFKKAGITEKPDIVVAKMLEGRVSILIEGSPVVLTLPFIIFEDIQNANDYYTNPIYTSFIRFIRIIGILVATIVPGLYLALRLYHYNILPLRFLITISNTTESLPFTPFIEMIFILILFQILYEASLRLPRYLGLATSIVGALILGETGVSAGLISPPGVMIIAMSIISVYIVPDQMAQLTILRVVFLIIGGTVGILGIIGAMIYIMNEMATFQRYNVPYLSPYAPRIKGDLKDGIIMQPISKMTMRPKSLNVKNKKRASEEN
ncbi:MAG: spore germination protein, partial [Clostridia bacterium]|nr:spore germination protein [Clostridia bacterium]